MSRRKTAEAHQELGNFRPSVHSPRTAPKSPKLPVKPRGLEPEVGKLWDQFAALLKDRLRPEDGPTLLLAARWHSVWQTAVEKLAEHEMGTVAHSRTLSTASQASQRFEAAAKRLGMSPADRELMTIGKPGEEGVETW